MKYCFYPILTFLLASLIAGCGANLEDFQEMSSYQRAQYVCERDKQIDYLDSQIYAASEAVEETKSVLIAGYRVHESCKQVRVPSGESCYYLGRTLQCTQTYSHETVCDQTPVAIDADLEKEKLSSYEKAHRDYIRQRTRRHNNCMDHVKTLGPARAFDYYQSIKKPFY